MYFFGPNLPQKTATFVNFSTKIVLNWGIEVFSTILKPYYTGDHTNQIHTIEGFPVLYMNVVVSLSSPKADKLVV